jgi:hypothetical protein
MFDRETAAVPRKHWVPDKGWVPEDDLSAEDREHRDRWHAELRRLSQRASPRRRAGDAPSATA